MTENSNNSNSRKKLKFFFIKLISISLAIMIIVNFLFNMILGERLDKIDNILSISDSSERHELRNKIRKEINKGLNKENLINEEDKILLYKLFLKIKEEFKDLDKSKI